MNFFFFILLIIVVRRGIRGISNDLNSFKKDERLQELMLYILLSLVFLVGGGFSICSGLGIGSVEVTMS